MENTAQQIEELHAEYVRLSGQRVSLMGREWAWYEWVKRGLTVQDLRMLVGHIRRERSAGRTVRGADLKFRNLVANADFAEEDIVELRARARARVHQAEPGKASVLRSAGRPPVSGGGAARSARECVERVIESQAGLKAFEEFRRLKENI